MCVMEEWARARTWREGQWPRCVALRMDTYIVLFFLVWRSFLQWKSDILRLCSSDARANHLLYDGFKCFFDSLNRNPKPNGIVCKQQCSVIYATPLPDFKLQLAEITPGSAESQLSLVFCLEFIFKNKVARVGWFIKIQYQKPHE